MKLCPRCKQKLPLDYFVIDYDIYKEEYKDPKKVKIYGYCHLCKIEYGRSYYQKNKDRIIAYKKQWYRDHKDQISEYDKERYKNNLAHASRYRSGV